MDNPARRPPPPPLRAVPPLPPPPLPRAQAVPNHAPVIFVGPPLESSRPSTSPSAQGWLESPTRPLKSVPPIPDDDLTANDSTNDFAGALAPQSTVVKFMNRFSSASNETRALVVRFLDWVRIRQQLRGAVALERVKPATMQPLVNFRAIDQAKVNKYVVSTYKLVGFAVLTIIVLALISYLGANVFYWFSTSWIEPTVIAPTDERVLSLSTQLVQQANSRDKLAADLADAERVQKMNEEFLAGAQKALRDELDDRKGELTKLRALDKSFASTRAEVASNGRAYTNFNKRKLRDELQAHFIDREAAVTGALQLSQIAQGNLSLGEQEVELFKRRAELTRETEALTAIVAGKQTSDKQQRHSIEVLKILQDVKRAEVELAKSRDYAEALRKSVARYDAIVKTLSDSPFVRAVNGQGTIAFVPYDNLAKVKKDVPLYGCYAGPLFCKRVGKVLAVLSGEMQVKHPLHNTMIRGQPVQVQLDDVADAERLVLFAGGRPLLF